MTSQSLDLELGADKLMTVSEAVAAHVRDGSRLAIGGCLYSRTPMALIFEVLRQGATDLQLARSLTCYEAELFIGTGRATTIETSWMGFGNRWGMSRLLREGVEGGSLTYNEYSHLGIAMRFRAAAMGVPFLPMRSMLGSDLLERTEAVEMRCPITDEPLVAVPAAEIDVALIHAHRGDRYGNVQIDGYRHMDFDIARAAKHVIVSVEELVEHEEITRHPDRTAIPHFAVDAIVHVPHGAYPHELYGVYDANFDHFDMYAERVREFGSQGVRSYVKEYVEELPDFESFLNTFEVTSVDASHTSAKDLT